MRTMTYTATRPDITDPLHFRRFTLEAIPEIRQYLDMSASRTCDYTIGGIYMWIDYFNYKYCIAHDTLFLQGVDEDDLSKTAYSLPIGRLDPAQAIELLKLHCAAAGEQLRFSAIPEDQLHIFAGEDSCHTFRLDTWSDYLYDACSLATLAGNHLKRKRNHVNRFMSDNPGAHLEPFCSTAIIESKQLLTRLAESSDDRSLVASVERTQVYNILDNWAAYSTVFEGAVLRDAAGSIVAFTVGEVIGDTLFVHIEKMDHTVPGAGETVNKLFAGLMLERHPLIRYINREEDMGDEGLRMAKQSYNPLCRLSKYNIVFP